MTTFDQLCAQLPKGAYTALRTFSGTKTLHLDAHLKRLQETARLVGSSAVLDLDTTRTALRQLFGSKPRSLDLRVRLVLDLEEHPGDLYLAALPLVKPPPEAYKSGVWVVTSELSRDMPRAKLTRFSARADRERQTLPSGAHEALMVDDLGCILEGLSSNFFAAKAGTLWTAEAGVLPGTTRAMVLELVDELGIPLRLECVPSDELPEFEEAFLTSVSRGVLPVRQVGEMVIHSGAPGPLTRRLMGAYEARLADELEEI
jgi:branched-subunit amino acid aminotransferase/4-amino-4-deoxychorismate lyase